MKGNGRWWLAGLLWVSAASADAAVLRVEQDGSGDYLTVQEGIDAAQPGDTVRIGAGRYDTFSVRTARTGGTIQAVGFVQTNGLVIEGVDAHSVRVGPSVPTSYVDNIVTVGVVVDGGVSGVAFKNLTLENVLAGAATAGVGTRFEGTNILNCTQLGVQLWTARDVVFRDCSFRENLRQGVWLVAQAPSHDVLIENCTFESNDTGVDNGAGTNVTVRDCRFDSNNVGLQYWAGATGLVERCEFGGETRSAVAVGHSATVLELNDCEMGPTSQATVPVESGYIRGVRNHFAGGAFATLSIRGGSGYASFSHSTILNGGGYSVYADPGHGSGEPFIDLRNNYWGTTDRAQIETWIQDRNDWPNFNTLPVVFEPFLEQPVGTQSQSIGELKASFAEPR